MNIKKENVYVPTESIFERYKSMQVNLSTLISANRFVYRTHRIYFYIEEFLLLGV